MNIKRVLTLSLAVLLICVIAFQATSCGLVADYINSLATSDSTDEVTTEVTKETTTQVTENTIPFVKTPDIELVKLPSEQFSDSIEREASEIIDDAIAKAISYVNAMRDDRHSNVSFSFVEDANGYLAKLTPEQKDLYDRFVIAGKNFNHLSVTDTGAEVITGSTRMKAGTAQKVILNMISTSVMVKCGYVYENLMINLKPTNEKLKKRCVGIVSEITSEPYEVSEKLLEDNQWDIKRAVDSYVKIK
ncbi:MAG: hypothetical protein K6F14_08090 [Clostridiales bacterium]|nr:hypothetical protein [Clostridiales bacterium]